MRIGEVAELATVSTKTLRYYEDVGLLERPGRSPSGYRDYDPSVLDRVGFIRSAQALGLTLGEIRGIVALRDVGDPPCGHVLQLLRARANEIGETIEQLRRHQRELQRLAERAEDLDPAACDPRRVCHLIGEPPTVSPG